MSLLKALGIDKYTNRFKQWIRDKFIAKGGLKTINGESIEGDGDIEIKGGADPYEDIYIIEDFTAKDIEYFGEGSLQIDGQGLSEAINNNKKIYIKYTNLASEPGMILCTTYKEDLYYISFRLNSSIYGFYIVEDFQHIDKNSIFKIDIQEQLESGKNIKTINGESLIGEGNIEISGGGSSVNADWNQNDSTQPDYIKNRTHYIKHQTYKIVFGETNKPHRYMCIGGESGDDEFEPFKVIINWNNKQIVIAPEDYGKVFYSDEGHGLIVSRIDYLGVAAVEFVFDPLDGYYEGLKDDNVEAYIVEAIVPIDEDYIPDTIARKSDLEGLGSGSLTAEEVSSTEPTAEFPQVLYTAQSLSEEQKSQARENIGVSEAIESAIASAITNVLNEEV